MTDTATTKGKVARAIVVGRGRMGTLVRQLLEEASDFSFVASFDATDASALDQNAPTADIVIDFSAPAALPHLAAYIPVSYTYLTLPTIYSLYMSVLSGASHYQ